MSGSAGTTDQRCVGGAEHGLEQREKEAEPKSGLQRAGAEAEQVGTQLLPWVAVGRLVRRQPACWLLQSEGGRIGTSWEPGLEGPEMEIGVVDPLSKALEDRTPRKSCVLGWMKP